MSTIPIAIGTLRSNLRYTLTANLQTWTKEEGFKGVIQAHHLVETRFLKLFNISKGEAPAIILEKSVHQRYTKLLMEKLPKGLEHSPSDVINTYYDVYSSEPEWIDAIKIMLGY